MRTPNPLNLEWMRCVAERLGEIKAGVVFVGGTVVDLLITDPVAPPARPTKDVDIIVQVTSENDYYQLSDLLRSLGFREDSQGEGGPLCRWIIDDIKVDTIPVRGEILGFSTEFYDAAVETAISREIADGLTIQHISAPCFLATKLDAFKDRGHNDYIGSHDMEDVIAVLDGRSEVIDEIRASPLKVKNFLVNSFAFLLDEAAFREAISGNLDFDGADSGRVPVFLDRVRSIASIEIDGP
jgi:predicted nucleotidyltransferase